MSDGNPAQTFVHMCFALAGAGIVMWGAQQVCDDKMSYAKCVASGKPSGTNTKEKIVAACAAKYGPDGNGTKKNTYIMYGGFGVIAGSVLVLWILNSFFGQGGGFGSQRY